MIGLVEAAQRYDFKKNDNFAAYARERIRGAMIDEFRREDVDHLGRHERGLRKLDPSRAEKQGYEFSSNRVDIGDQDLWDVVLSKAGDQIARLEQRYLRELLNVLPFRLKTVMTMYYFEDKTDKEIGEVYGVSGSRICQLRVTAVRKIHSHLRKKGVF